MDDRIRRRATRHAALGDPLRLAVVDDLACSDRSPATLAHRLGIESNLLAHHLDVLEGAGLIERSRSSGDGRRRYVHLRHTALDELRPGPAPVTGPALFICTANSARSPLAAAIWTARTGQPAASAGTHPADRLHPGALAAARRAGLDVGDHRPTTLDPTASLPPIVVTVCDRAHEELGPQDDWLHWSVPDPAAGDDAAFDAAIAELTSRVTALAGLGVR